jgi:hypothetical protein
MLKSFSVFAFSVLALSAAHAAERKITGVKIFVREVQNKDKTYSYHYRVVNNGTVPISRLRIGQKKDAGRLLTKQMFVTFREEKEKSGNILFLASVQTPEQYTHELYDVDDGYDGHWALVIENMSSVNANIHPGQTLRGFVVQTKKRESVFINSAISAEYGSDEYPVVPQKEVLSESALSVQPTFTKLSVSPETVSVDKFENQEITFSADIGATSGNASEPVIRIQAINCAGPHIEYNKDSQRLQREKKFVIVAEKRLQRSLKVFKGL